MISLSDIKEKKSTVKQVYTEFYDQLVEAVSDPHTCQLLIAQLHSTISQEKIVQLKSGQTSGSEFLKVLGVEEEPHLLTVLMEKMAGMKQLQTLAEQMTARLSELQGTYSYECVRVCVCVCVCACVHACVHVCVHACVHVFTLVFHC